MTTREKTIETEPDMNEIAEKKRRELDFQARRAREMGNIKPTPRHVIEKYRKNPRWRYIPKEFVFKTLGNLEGKSVCDFGCGEGVLTSQLAGLGAKVTSVDISPDLIEKARKRVELDGVAHRVNFVVADAEEMKVPAEEFDLVVAYEVLHHVEIPVVMEKLIKSLKPGGRAVIIEPVAFSPILRKVRALTPVAVDGDSDDRQLTKEEVDEIRGFFDSSETTFFRLLGRLARLAPGRFRFPALMTLSVIDRFLLGALPPVRKFSGVVVVHGRKGKK